MRRHRPSVLDDQDVQLPRRPRLHVVRAKADEQLELPRGEVLRLDVLPEVRRERARAWLALAAITTSLLAGVVLVLAALGLL